MLLYGTCDAQQLKTGTGLTSSSPVHTQLRSSGGVSHGELSELGVAEIGSDPNLVYFPFSGVLPFLVVSTFEFIPISDSRGETQHVHSCPVPPPMTPHFSVARSVSVQSEICVLHQSIRIPPQVGFHRNFYQCRQSGAVT